MRFVQNLHSMLLPKPVWELMAVRWFIASGKYEHASQPSGGHHIHLWIFTIQEDRVTASTLYILNPTEKSINVSMNWLELSVQSPLNCRTDLTALHRKDQFSPSLSTYSPQKHTTWFVYMPKHVSFLIPWLYCSACNTCKSVTTWYHKKEIKKKEKNAIVFNFLRQKHRWECLLHISLSVWMPAAGGCARGHRKNPSLGQSSFIILCCSDVSQNPFKRRRKRKKYLMECQKYWKQSQSLREYAEKGWSYVFSGFRYPLVT